MGLVLRAGRTIPLPRRIGRQRTAWLALSGERLDAQRALDWGLIDELRWFLPPNKLQKRSQLEAPTFSIVRACSRKRFRSIVLRVAGKRPSGLGVGQDEYSRTSPVFENVADRILFRTAFVRCLSLPLVEIPSRVCVVSDQELFIRSWLDTRRL